MADRIIIEGVQPFDGTYDLDPSGQPFSALEWNWIRRIADYLPMTIDDGLAGGDPMLFVSLAVIALYRAGKITKEETLETGRQLADAPFDGTSISYVVEEAGPPAEEEPAEDEPSSSSDDSGDDSSPLTESPENGQSSIGSPDWARSAISGPMTSTS